MLKSYKVKKTESTHLKKIWENKNKKKNKNKN